MLPFTPALLLLLSSTSSVPLPSISKEYGTLAAGGSRSAQVISGEFALREGDTGAAFYWLTAAAESGDPTAQIHLGDLYVNGRGTVRDPARAAHYYALAVGSSAEAQWKLGALFQEGDGVPRNLEIAASMFRRAADQGYADAQNSLATMYIAGLGVKQDSKEAIKWYRKAAAQNCADAQLNLAGLYYHGIGVKQDLAAAREWAIKARAFKIREADAMLAQIERARAETRASSSNNE
jgi:TPR repeat protein